MIQKTIEHFSLPQICDSGQCFRMKAVDGHSFSVIAGDRYLLVSQEGSLCTFHCDDREFETFWKDYFDMDSDYAAYIDKINPKDKYLMEAADFGSGIRILRQDLWEMIVSFLISQQNNITRIRKCIDNICRTYGKTCVNEAGETYNAFPEPKVLADLDEDALKACNLGYRSKYVVRTARSIVSGEVDLNRICGMTYPEAKEELLKLFGVGVKVADCICLFALHHLSAFPMDTHMIQAMEKHYPKGFPKRRYRGFEGVMQQYIFYYELKGK